MMISFLLSSSSSFFSRKSSIDLYQNIQHGHRLIKDQRESLNYNDELFSFSQMRTDTSTDGYTDSAVRSSRRNCNGNRQDWSLNLKHVSHTTRQTQWDICRRNEQLHHRYTPTSTVYNNNNNNNNKKMLCYLLKFQIVQPSIMLISQTSQHYMPSAYLINSHEASSRFTSAIWMVLNEMLRHINLFLVLCLFACF